MISAEQINEKTTWQNLTPGCEIYEPGTSRLTKTGEWRVRTPKWIKEKCKQCLLCAPFCPDSSIPVEDGRRGEFDYDHCKGCGICLKACPFDAIEMTDETKDPQTKG
ncbi:MAG: 4Fe-4S binding protein [Lachnospiraceae bacterium]|nr:4Fe-4S binding protein [Lachnospiraceae bacterium]